MLNSKYFQVVGGGIIFATILVFAQNWLNDNYPALRLISFVLILLLVLCWLVYLVTRRLRDLYSSTRFAVQALIFDSEGRVLFYSHPYHGKRIPPGGRANFNEFPEEALTRCLKERLGMSESDYTFDIAIHQSARPLLGDIGNVVRIHEPFLIQRELRKQRFLVNSHYDFIYVLKYIGDGRFPATGRYAPVRFLEMAEIEKLVDRRETFSDVLEACKRVILARGHK
jgi:ADP-ribose pyrophosphatase YjhB (NUDIX family)